MRKKQARPQRIARGMEVAAARSISIALARRETGGRLGASPANSLISALPRDVTYIVHPEDDPASAREFTPRQFFDHWCTHAWPLLRGGVHMVVRRRSGGEQVDAWVVYGAEIARATSLTLETLTGSEYTQSIRITVFLAPRPSVTFEGGEPRFAAERVLTLLRILEFSGREFERASLPHRRVVHAPSPIMDPRILRLVRATFPGA